MTHKQNFFRKDFKTCPAKKLYRNGGSEACNMKPSNHAWMMPDGYMPFLHTSILLPEVGDMNYQ